MTATLIEPRTYEVTEPDPVWNVLMDTCESAGTLVIRDQTGRVFHLQNATKKPARELVTELPDFEARMRKLWPDGPALNDEETAQLDKSIR